MKKQTKYYCLLLDNCYDNYSDNLCSEKHSCIVDVLENTYPSLNIRKISNYFHGFDSKIKFKENKVTVKGRFPVIAYEENGKLYEAVTGELIVSSKEVSNPKGLSYSEKFPVKEQKAKMLLSRLDEFELRTYKDTIKGMKYYAQLLFLGVDTTDYYRLDMKMPNDMEEIFPMYAKNVYGKMIEIATEMPIYYNESNSENKGLTYTDAEKVEKREIIEFYNYIADGEENIEYVNYINNLIQNQLIAYSNAGKNNKITKTNNKKRIKIRKKSAN